MRVALVGAEIEENLALRSIAASLEHAGHSVEVFDFHEADQVPEVARGIAHSGVELVGLSMIFTARSREFIELARAIRERGFGGHVTAGGHFASLHAEQLLDDESAIDSVIHGDGEEPMVELAASPQRPAEVAGVVYRDADGLVCATAVRPTPDDLDGRPWPRRPQRFHSYLGVPIANLLASRGCYASCAFCSIRAFHERSGGRRFRQRRPEAVADEMAALYHERGVGIFNFQDDNFFVPSAEANLERFRALRRALEQRGVGRIAIQAKGRPDCMDEEVIALLRTMGLFRLFLGIETNAVTGLRTLGRGMELHHNHRALRMLRRQSIHTCFNLLMFDPDSTLQTIQTNVDFMGQQDWFPLNFCRVEVYGGTPLEARLSAEGRLLGDYLGYSYRIADPRAQRAYELFRQVFWPRNFALDGAHFGSMKLDYHLHLLAHLQPTLLLGDSWRRSKGLVHELNRHSAGLMGRILRFAATDRFDDDRSCQALAAELEDERAGVDESLRRRMNDGVEELETLAARGPGRRRLLRVAMGTAAAAALATAAPACAKQTHMCEAPPPPPHDDTHMCEAPPPPEPEPSLQGAELDRVRAAVQQRIDQRLRQSLGQQHPEAERLELEIIVEPSGAVMRCQRADGSAQGVAEPLCQSLQAEPLTIAGLPPLGPRHIGYRARFPVFWKPVKAVASDRDAANPWPADSKPEDRNAIDPQPGDERQVAPPRDKTHMCEAPPPPDHDMLEPNKPFK